MNKRFFGLICLFICITTFSSNFQYSNACINIVDLDNLCYTNTNMNKPWRFANYWAAIGYRSYPEWYVYGRLQEDEKRLFSNLRSGPLGNPLFQTNAGGWANEVRNLANSNLPGYAVYNPPAPANYVCGNIAVWDATVGNVAHQEHVAYIEGVDAAGGLLVTESGVDVENSVFAALPYPKRIMITWSGVHLREKPNANSKLIRHLKRYGLYRILKAPVKNGVYNWYNIAGPDCQGWVALLTDQGARPSKNMCGIFIEPHAPIYGTPNLVLQIPVDFPLPPPPPLPIGNN